MLSCCLLLIKVGEDCLLFKCHLTLSNKLKSCVLLPTTMPYSFKQTGGKLILVLKSVLRLVSGTSRRVGIVSNDLNILFPLLTIEEQ